MAGTAKLPTMDDVAQRAGVSRALVSLVMRNSPKVSRQSRLAVLEAAEALGYRPNAMARTLAQQRSQTVGVVINDLHNPFFAEVAEGVHDVAVDRGYRLLLSSAWLGVEAEHRSIEAFLEHRVDGLIVIGSMADEAVLQAAAGAVPLVVVGRDVAGVDVVINDDEVGGRLVAEHLVAAGHRDIAHITGGAGAGAMNRRRGFEAALAEAGVRARILPGDFTEEAGRRAAELLLGSGSVPTAVFGANDLTAAGCRERLEEAGLLVPGDVSVVGYDATRLARNLTSVDQHSRDMGRLAMGCVLERLGGFRTATVKHVVQPDLVVRQTTGPPATRPTRRRSAGPLPAG
jgi:DNA-binding LacI/PurR family transcriptional regulator